MNYVYILKSLKDDKLYMGYTHNLRGRLKQHQSGLSKATKTRLPVELIYYEAFKDREDAKKREASLKQLGQAMRQLKSRIEGSIKASSHAR